MDNELARVQRMLYMEPDNPRWLRMRDIIIARAGGQVMPVENEVLIRGRLDEAFKKLAFARFPLRPGTIEIFCYTKDYMNGGMVREYLAKDDGEGKMVGIEFAAWNGTIDYKTGIFEMRAHMFLNMGLYADYSWFLSKAPACTRQSPASN